MDKIGIGKNIKWNREKMNLSQTELAKRMNTTRQCISSWELGRTQPDVAAIDKLSQILCVSVSVLMGLSTAEINISDIENKMKSLDIIALDRIIKYAEYLKTLQGGD